MIIRRPGFKPTRSRSVVFDGIVNIVAVSGTLGESTLEQCNGALHALDLALEEAGSDKNHVLTVTVFLMDMKSKQDLNSAWDGWASITDPPLRACLGATLEPGYLVELLVTAVTIERAARKATD